MAPKDSKIEACLRETVREASKKGEDVTVKRVRKRTEEKLGLETDYLKEGAWKGKSKAIIEAAFEEPDEQTKSSPEKEKRTEDVPKPQKSSKTKKDEGKERPSSSGSGSAGTTQPPERPDTAAPTVNGVKRKAPETEPTAAAGSKTAAGTVDKQPSQPPSKKAKTAAAEPPAPKSSTEEKEEEDESSSGSEDSSSSEENGSEAGSSGSSGDEVESLPSPEKPPEPTQEDTVQAIPPKAFKPPSGYTPIDSSLFSSNSAPLPANLESKQIWHITAPSNVPLTSLTELSLSSIASAEPVLTHKSIPYILTEDTTTSSNPNAEPTALLLPGKEGYQKAASTRIARTLHLQQKLELPNLSTLQASQNTGSKAAGDVAQAPVSTVRPQPKGLRMRFKPPGFGKGRPGFIGAGVEEDEGESEGNGRPSFQFPKTLGQHGVEVTQDGDTEMVDSAEVADGKKGKKGKKRKERENDGGAAKTNGVSPPAEAANGLPNGTAEKESKEEKKRRKEEKRARKEAKAKVGA